MNSLNNQSTKKTFKWMEKGDNTQPEIIKITLAIFVAALIVSLYFCREMVDKYSDTHLEISSINDKAFENFSQKREAVLNKFTADKDYQAYVVAKERYDAANEVFKKSKKDEVVFGFYNKKVFLFKLGPNIFWFLLVLFLLYRSFYFERKNTGIKIILATALSLTLYEFFYIFYPVQDLSLATYYLMGFCTSLLLTLAIYFNTKYKEHYVNVLKKKMLQLADFTIKNTKEDKQPEMVSLLKTLKNEK